jgi:hypothetical protein
MIRAWLPKIVPFPEEAPDGTVVFMWTLPSAATARDPRTVIASDESMKLNTTRHVVGR